MKLEENLLEKFEWNEEIKTNKITKVIEYIKDNLKEILDTPKWWYPIVFLWWIVWFVLWTTILVFIPWVTFIFIIWSSKVVKSVNIKINKKMQ